MDLEQNSKSEAAVFQNTPISLKGCCSPPAPDAARLLSCCLLFADKCIVLQVEPLPPAVAPARGPGGSKHWPFVVAEQSVGVPVPGPANAARAIVTPAAADNVPLVPTQGGGGCRGLPDSPSRTGATSAPEWPCASSHPSDHAPGGVNKLIQVNFSADPNFLLELCSTINVSGGLRMQLFSSAL